MKKIKLFSKIILIIQCIAVANLLTIPFLTHPFGAFDFLVKGLGFFLPFGMRFAFPLGIICFIFEAGNFIFSLKNKKPLLKTFLIAVVHLILGALNYVLYMSLWYI